MSTTLETWSTKLEISIGFDQSGLPVDLNRTELRMLIEALQDVENMAIPDEMDNGDTVYKEYAIKDTD